jgi:hypothetical protein
MSPLLRQPLSPSADASVDGSAFSSPPLVAADGEDRPPEGAALGPTLAAVLAAGAELVFVGVLELLQAVRLAARATALTAMAMRTFFVIPLPRLMSLGR